MSKVDLDLLDMDLEVLLASPMDPGAGITASDEAIKREVVKQLIYKKADFISTGVRLVGLETFDNLDIKYSFPSEAAVEYPVAEGAGADLTKITWADFSFSLKKAEGRFMITDEAQIRGVDRTQWQTGIRRLGEAFAIRKDRNILGTLYTGAGNTHACAATWDTTTAANISQDISTIVNYLLNAYGATDADLSNIVFIVPIKAWSGLLRIFNINQANVQLLSWIEDSYKISIRPTKDATFTAGLYGVALITGADTSIHGVLRAPAGIPLVENKRHEGVGSEYIVRQFFATTVVPEESGTITSNRICKVNSVMS